MSAPPMYNDQKPPPYVQQPQPQQAYMAPPPTGPYIQQQPGIDEFLRTEFQAILLIEKFLIKLWDKVQSLSLIIALCQLSL